MGLSISLAVHNHFQKCTLSNLNMALEHQFLDVLEPVLFFLFLFVSAPEHGDIELACIVQCLSLIMT